ncbi:MAG: hypothetical protein AB1390_11820 [Nitrospirota bacterium]
MFKKIMIGLLGMCLMALLVTEANSAVCIAKVGGRCVAWSGTIECGIDASGLGNCIDNPVFLGCIAHGNSNWVVACGNPGSNNWTAPGINVFYFDGTLSGQILVDPSMCDKNGNAFATVYAEASQSFLDGLVLAGACPNPNWIARDAVPCAMTLTDQEIDENGCVVADATFDCTLPNCETLGWDVDTQKFERRQYDCVRTQYNRYKEPVCPAQ